MNDREEVVKELEKVSHYFKSMLKVGYQGDADVYREHRKSIKMAIALLKEQNELLKQQDETLNEQEAVEPTLIREGRNMNYNDYVCPRCDNEVVYEQNYCSECGIPFLWKGGEQDGQKTRI